MRPFTQTYSMRAQPILKVAPTIVEGAWSIKPTTNKTLIASLRSQRVAKSNAVIQTLLAVDRAKYSLDPETAYFDQPQGIGHRQITFAPYLHAFLLENLRPHLRQGAKILDIGSGSGYLTACFAKLVRQPVAPTGRVFGIERIKRLASWSQQNLKSANPELLDVVTIAHGDGSNGYEKEAPYDVIHVGVACTDIPAPLLHQLKEGGRMIIPLGQMLMQVDNVRGEVITRVLINAMYPPMNRGVEE